MYATDYNGSYPEPAGGDFVSAYAGGGGQGNGNGNGNGGNGKGKGKGKGCGADCMDGLEQYLPGGVLPKSPWSSVAQYTFAKVEDGLAKAEELVKQEKTLTPVNTRISGGEVPAGVEGNKFKAKHYGAISYNYNQSAAVYVLYGTGKKGRDAVVAGAISNGGQ